MYIDEGVRHFIVCDFYGVETCFCWNVDRPRLVVFSYATRDVRVLSTPAPVRQVQCFDGRVFVLCAPRGIYKLARGGAFAVLSKNALGMGAEFYEVLVAKESDIHLDDKQNKDSRPLFKCSAASIEKLHSLPLTLADTEERFLECFGGNDRREKRNVCVIGYGRRLFAWTGDAVRLIYADATGVISRLTPVKRGDKVAGVLLLVNMDTVILMHSRDCDLLFQKVWLGRDVRCASTLCASFGSDNVLWIVYCDQSKLYNMKKELFTDRVEETKVEEGTFTCMQCYKSNVILALSDNKELLELSMEKDSLPVNDNIELRADMFRNTGLIMERICDKVRELDKLYEKLANEQDELRRINMYAYNQKIEANPQIEACRLWDHSYLVLSIPEKLPRNTHVAFTFKSKYQSTFCVKKVTEATFTVKMSINESNVLRSSTVNMDLITLANKEIPWCIIQNFITCPTQKEARTRGSKKEKDKMAFIDAKIASLENLIEQNDSSMTKLSEIKRIIRAEL